LTPITTNLDAENSALDDIFVSQRYCDLFPTKVSEKNFMAHMVPNDIASFKYQATLLEDIQISRGKTCKMIILS
jgi:hypothetical protein